MPLSTVCVSAVSNRPRLWSSQTNIRVKDKDEPPPSGIMNTAEEISIYRNPQDFYPTKRSTLGSSIDRWTNLRVRFPREELEEGEEMVDRKPVSSQKERGERQQQRGGHQEGFPESEEAEERRRRCTNSEKTRAFYRIPREDSRAMPVGISPWCLRPAILLNRKALITRSPT
ncbi:uncharacterized protein LOC143203415 [Rhynchophorus ferrugineus]|uniref:uncharacterized protein LOC143203415 n=1 Tax=Rhynchophorus ferrugineus TaxID=354439 RepID=UPI003FCC3D06